MKGSLVVVAFFCAGCMIGAVNNFQYDMHSVSMYVLYALMLQVGISIGSNKKLKELIKSLRFKEPSIGLQLATELGTIALLANIFREMMALLGAPLIRKYFGQLAPISAAGVNSMDVLLPSITRYSGKDMIPLAIFHGILIDMSVPVFVSFFCNL